MLSIRTQARLKRYSAAIAPWLLVAAVAAIAGSSTALAILGAQGRLLP